MHIGEYIIDSLIGKKVEIVGPWKHLYENEKMVVDFTPIYYTNLEDYSSIKGTLVSSRIPPDGPMAIMIGGHRVDFFAHELLYLYNLGRFKEATP